MSLTDDRPVMRAISADSHVTEPPNCFIDNIEARYRDTAPRLGHDAVRGDIFLIEGMPGGVALGLAAAAGKDPRTITVDNCRFEDLHRGGWDPKVRMADQDRDGVGAEVIYPSVGMVLCNHPDVKYKQACFRAYNRWLAEFQAGAPDRLFGIPIIAIDDVPTAIKEIAGLYDQGFKGVLLPALPDTGFDYDQQEFDPFWAALAERRMPISFHVFGGGKNNSLRAGDQRGPAMNKFQDVIRVNQDIIGMFVLGGVFERHPTLRLVCVEGDAGWLPHYTYRMDHAFHRHRFWLKPGADLVRPPSEYIQENVYLTFQDDWVAFQVANLVNPRRLLWANDFPHSDSTWPWSQDMLKQHAAHLDDEQRRWILHDNVAELYGLDVPLH